MGMYLTHKREDPSLDSCVHVRAGCSWVFCKPSAGEQGHEGHWSSLLRHASHNNKCGVSKRPHVKNKNHQQQKTQVEKLLRMIREIRHWLPHVHTQESTVAQAHTNTYIKIETFNKS